MRNVCEATIGQYCRAAVLISALLLMVMGMGSGFAQAQDYRLERKKAGSPGWRSAEAGDLCKAGFRGIVE